MEYDEFNGTWIVEPREMEVIWDLIKELKISEMVEQKPKINLNILSSIIEDIKKVY